MKHVRGILLLLLLPAVSIAQKGFVIKGNVSGIRSGYAGVKEFQEIRDLKAPSLPAEVRIVDGTFTVTGSLQNPRVAFFKVSTRVFPIFLENTSYTVEGRLDSLSGASFKGGALNDEYQAYLASGVSGMDYLKAHPNSALSAYLTLQETTNAASKALVAYALLGPDGRKNWAGKAAAANMAAFKKGSAGAVFPNLKMKDTSGRSMSVRQMAGQIVVVDFWASWCGPCRAFVPTLRQHYLAYTPKGVKFLSVSADADVDDWKEAMADLKMEWPQALAEGAFHSGTGIKDLLHIYYIPHTIVIGKDGKIAASLDGYQTDQLKEKLDALLQ